GMRDEAQTMMRARVERFLADSQLVTREEFEAVRDMAQKAREENEALAARLVALEAALAAKG
ncbi:MAG: pyrroline-5-carboxylate reductase, partial [Rhodobacterales bacterium CG_4_9_14_3_um_filter_71_31]